MNKKYLALISRIREELSKVKKLSKVPKQFFELIAVNIDQTKPQGENWHQELLRQMASEIELVRP